jgi:hypothetical protein
MKSRLFSTALISMILSCSGESKDYIDNSSAQIPINASVLEKESKELGDYALLMMRIVNADLSTIRKNVIARSIVTVANDIFSSLDEKKQFVVMIAIESKFNTNAKSPVGALGLTQIMPQYAREFGTACGVKDLRDEDLIHPDVNLILGACRFKALLDAFNGQPVPALVAYNAGLASNQLKQLQSLREITNTETASYVVKWAYVKGQADKQTETRREKITIKVRSGGPKQGEKKENTRSEESNKETQDPTPEG